MQFEIPNDPIILLGIINMNLRDFYPSMDALCDDMELNFLEIDRILSDAGFSYDVPTNQYHKK
jgi:hypothetical protein